MASNLTINDVALSLGVSYQTARELMLSGQIESYNVGIGRRKFLRTTAEAVEAYLRRNKVDSHKPMLSKIDPKQSGRL